MCWKCGTLIDSTVNIYRTTECPVCGADLHCCRNCRFYAPGSHYDCRETVEEAVSDKECANFCDHFSVCQDAGNRTGTDTAEKARNAFDSLFGSMICR